MTKQVELDSFAVITEIVKKTFEKKEYIDNFNLLCNNLDDNIFKFEDRDNLIILKDKKTYYPIFLIEKKTEKENAKIKKKAVSKSCHITS